MPPSSPAAQKRPMKERVLLTARRTGNNLSLGGRVPLVQALLRRACRYVGGKVRINDFDGDLAIELLLSEHMQRRIFWMGFYNRDIVALLDRLVRPGMTFIDVGANIGEITLVAAKRVGAGGRVIAFEPVDLVAERLQAHVTWNGLAQVAVVRAGLADSRGTAPIFASTGHKSDGEENWGLNSLFGSDADQIPLQMVQLTTLDGYFDEHKLDQVDILKIDIEGSELPCLKGARDTLRKFKPHLIIEIQNDSADAAGYSPADILDYLAGLGYRFECIGRLGTLSTLDRRNLSNYQNVLCTAQ
jgi:FkbM family methyltransferase